MGRIGFSGGFKRGVAMGRGKSKAKQTKVARELKYGSSGSDLSALEAELKGEGKSEDSAQEQEFEERD